jgi:hypothetical protein
MKIKWQPLAYYAVASCIGLFLDLYHPDVKAVLCTPTSIDRRNNPETTSINSHSTDREK